MNIEDIEKELVRRRTIIDKNLKVSEINNKDDNERVKNKIQDNYIDIQTLYQNPRKIINDINNFFDETLVFFQNDGIYDGKKITIGYFYKKLFCDLFSKERANALVNLLQPVNNRVYNRECIESLKFSKDEILKGFKKENIENDNTNELQVKILFWINKLTKLIDYKEIDVLKAKPMNVNSEENYFKASKRVEILKLIRDALDVKTSNKLKDEYEERYYNTFGVSIEEDIKNIALYDEVKAKVYELKNGLMLGLMSKYFANLKKGKELSGIQAMGITKNEVGLTDSLGSYMAVIRLKGYTSNIYLHTPSTGFAEVVRIIRANGLENRIPETVYSSVNSNKIIPVNVICKIDKNSERYRMIKKEKEEKPQNQALKQAEQQIRCSKLTPIQTSKWKNEKIEEI